MTMFLQFIAQAEGGSPGGGFGPMAVMIAVLFAMMYFMVIRPRNREQDNQKKMLEALKKGDRIVTRGGLIGRVVELRDKEIVIKIDETNNTKAHVRRSFVLAVLGDEKADKEMDAKPAE